VNKITRNDEERAAFEALRSAVREMPIGDDNYATAEAIERTLLALGYAITKIEPINI